MPHGWKPAGGARQRPFADWLRALGMPASGAAELTDWATLRGHSASEWQAIAGLGIARATQLAAFFDHPGVSMQAARLRKAGVHGF